VSKNFFERKEAAFKYIVGTFMRSQHNQNEADVVRLKIIALSLEELELCKQGTFNREIQTSHWKKRQVLMSEYNNLCMVSDIQYEKALELREKYINEYSAGGVVAPAPQFYRTKRWVAKSALVDITPQPAESIGEEFPLSVVGIVWDTNKGDEIAYFDVPVKTTAVVFNRIEWSDNNLGAEILGHRLEWWAGSLRIELSSLNAKGA